MKICPVGAELLHVDGQADMMKLTVALHSFVNLPTNCPWGGKPHTHTHAVNNQVTIHTDVFAAVRNEKQGLFHNGR